MDNGLLQEGLTVLKAGEVLRLRKVAGRHLAVLQGSAWVTQDGDTRDFIVGAGQSLRFDRDGLALVMPLGAETRLLLEDGLAAEDDDAPGYFSAHGEDLAYFERRAQKMRAEEFARWMGSLAGWLKGLWARLDRAATRAARSLQTSRELHALSDRNLRDIGVRRDQIDCLTRQVPC